MSEEEISELSKNVALILQRIDDKILPMLEDHHKVLYGDPQTMGKNGVISTVREHTDFIKNAPEGQRRFEKELKEKVFLVWTLIVFFLTIGIRLLEFFWARK